jgi:IS605 OrfB family transposase
VKLTAKVKLCPSPEQHKLLLETLERANAACNYISDVAWRERVWRQFSLHKLTYYDTKDRFDLSAQMVVRCESKVADAYKLDKKTKRTFKPHGAIAYDSRILTWKQDAQTVNIWTLEGRQKIAYQAGDKQQELLKNQQGESDLVYIKGVFYLLATCDIPEPTPSDVEGYLGVDLGIANIAVDSQGTHHGGAKVNGIRERRRRQRKRLQKKGTKSAKRVLKRLSGKEKRFQRTENHRIAKAIVEKARTHSQGIAFEQLKGITKRVRVRKPQRIRLYSWAVADLSAKIEYKAKRAGVPLVYVDPAYTSQTCPECGHIAKANRKTRDVFVCEHCSTSGSADHIAARNISTRAGQSVNLLNAVGL